MGFLIILCVSNIKKSILHMPLWHIAHVILEQILYTRATAFIGYENLRPTIKNQTASQLSCSFLDTVFEE